MESFKADISIFFPSQSFSFNKSIIQNNYLYYEYDSSYFLYLKKVLQTLYHTLKGDINSTPNFDTSIKISNLSNSILLSIASDDISKFRASILTILRLLDLTYSMIKIDI